MEGEGFRFNDRGVRGGVAQYVLEIFNLEKVLDISTEILTKIHFSPSS
jgi:hypothetical protein